MLGNASQPLESESVVRPWSSTPPIPFRETNMKYRAVLVENEELSLSRLRRLLSSFPMQVEIVGEATTGPDAVQVIRELNPDVVFLDIDLPGLSGFEVLARLEQQPAVIFTTAFNQHALDAFKTYAVDYLLKPIGVEAVGRAVGKLGAMGFGRDRLTEALERLLPPSARYLSRFPCRVGDRTILLQVSDIMYFQADNKYTSVFTLDRDFLVDTPLVDLEKKLDPQEFVRIHRATLVAVSWIEELRRSDDGRYRVFLKDTKHTELRASRTYSDNLKKL